MSKASTKRISNSIQFQNNVKKILTYNFAMFAILGEKWSTNFNNVPLFYINKDKIYPVRFLLQLFLSDIPIEQLTTSNFGP